MFGDISNYFSSLNNAGQALFIVGSLLIITFIILLIIVLKPERKPKKIYGESVQTDRENQFEEKMKNIDNISINDINIDNDKTRNLKYIVDELKQVEARNNKPLDVIDKYESEQEDTAVISVNELLNNNYVKPESIVRVNNTYGDEFLFDEPEPIKPPVETRREDVYNEPLKPVIETRKEEVYTEPKKYVRGPEIFSSVFVNETKPEEKKIESVDNHDNENFLNSLKEFRNNL